MVGRLTSGVGALIAIDSSCNEVWSLDMESQIVGSVAVGYFFFGDFPDLLTWIGAAIIVGSGLYIGWSQTRKS